MYAAAFDMVYSADGTAWTRAVSAAGLPAVDGKEMLLQQAAPAFEIWFDIDAPIKQMRAAMATPRV